MSALLVECLLTIFTCSFLCCVKTPYVGSVKLRPTLATHGEDVVTSFPLEASNILPQPYLLVALSYC